MEKSPEMLEKSDSNPSRAKYSFFNVPVRQRKKTHITLCHFLTKMSSPVTQSTD